MGHHRKPGARGRQDPGRAHRWRRHGAQRRLRHPAAQELAGPYDFRAIRNELHRTWEERIDALRAAPEAARAAYDAGVAAGDYRFAHATVGEAVGLVHDVPDAATVLQQMHTEAQQRLGER